MNNETQWVQPTPLRGNRSNLIDFPVNALPPILREMAYAISRTTLSDVSMAATSILSSVSYCFSGQFRIVGKKDHSEPLVIDSLIVAEASFKKSPVMKLVAKPYQDYVQEYNEKNKALILENQAKKKVIANKLAALEKKADADTKEMSDLAMELSSITNADFRRIIVDDITPESLVRQLAINGTLLMMSDEAGSLGNFNGRYSANGAPNLDLLLKSWNGETFISDRITRESVILYKDHREEMYKAQQDVKVLETRVKAMEKEDEPDTAAIAKLRVQADNIRNTTPIRIAVDDITPESLVIELSENDSLLMISDEAGMLSNFNGKYNGGIPKESMCCCQDWGGKFHELKAKLSAVYSELATYKKAEEQKGLFTREKLKKEAARISREDELSRELRKAKAFISACGLSSDYQQYKYNSTTRKNVLE